MDKIEIYLELTQDEANAVAAIVEDYVATTIGESQLLHYVAGKFHDATRDARQRASDDDHLAWMNRDN